MYSGLKSFSCPDLVVIPEGGSIFNGAGGGKETGAKMRVW